jgi:hypothetical protein
MRSDISIIILVSVYKTQNICFLVSGLSGCCRVWRRGTPPTIFVCGLKKRKKKKKVGRTNNGNLVSLMQKSAMHFSTGHLEFPYFAHTAITYRLLLGRNMRIPGPQLFGQRWVGDGAHQGAESRCTVGMATKISKHTSFSNGQLEFPYFAHTDTTLRLRLGRNMRTPCYQLRSERDSMW